MGTPILEEVLECTGNHKETIDDCTASAFKTKYGVQFYDHSVKACAVLEIVDECIQSINGNCATDEFFSSDLFIIQQECHQEKFGCSENHKKTIIDCATFATRTKYGEHYYDYNGKACEILEIADECLESINENCANDAFFSTSLSALKTNVTKRSKPHE